MKKVNFYFLDRNPVLKDRKKLKTYIERLFIQKNKNITTLSYIFCSDRYLLNINNEFLHHDFYTDVVTFDLGSKKEGIEGEVYLSVDRIRDNAKKHGVSFNEELHRVIFHGALHLCGYNDKKKEDILTMRRAEEKLIAEYFQ